MKFLPILAAAFLIVFSGCAHQVSTGTNSVVIGEVGVTKSLVYSGDLVDDTLRVSADENGNARIVAGKGLIEIVPFYLSSEAISEFTGYLDKLISWGEIANKENIETAKNVGSISTDTGFTGGTVIVSTKFRSSSNGKLWIGSFNFCQLQSQAELLFGKNRPLGTDPCVRNVDIYVSPNSVTKLKEYLAMVPEYSRKASESKIKSDLLK